MVQAADWLRSYPSGQRSLQMGESVEAKRERAHRLVMQLIEATGDERDRDALKLAATIILESRVCEVVSSKADDIRDVNLIG